MLFQPLGDLLRVAAMLFHAEFQSLDPLQEQERVERTHARTKIAQALDARLDDESQPAEDLRELHAVVARTGFGELREFLAPRKLSAIDDDAADGRAVTAQKLGGGVDHDIRAVLHGAAEIGRGHGVIDN